VDGFLDGVHAVFVGGKVDDAALHAGSGEPGAGPRGMMLAALVIRGVIEKRAAELGGADGEGVDESLFNFS
jgi:hypothetical protein